VHRRRLVGLVLSCALALGACVAPARTLKPYVADAVTTAQQTRSAVQTALLASQFAARGNASSNYLSALLGDTENTAAAVQSSFDSEQPPNSAADRLRNVLDSMLQEASGTLVALRIHARRGEIASLTHIAAPLHKVSHNLDRFIAAHQ
jgi:hypothetical protein